MSACGVPRFGDDLLVVVDMVRTPPRDRGDQPARLLTTA
jgi:hypothetical protein